MQRISCIHSGVTHLLLMLLLMLLLLLLLLLTLLLLLLLLLMLILMEQPSCNKADATTLVQECLGL